MGVHIARPEITFVPLPCTQEVFTVGSKPIQQTIICTSISRFRWYEIIHFNISRYCNGFLCRNRFFRSGRGFRDIFGFIVSVADCVYFCLLLRGQVAAMLDHVLYTLGYLVPFEHDRLAVGFREFDALCVMVF